MLKKMYIRDTPRTIKMDEKYCGGRKRVGVKKSKGKSWRRGWKSGENFHLRKLSFTRRRPGRETRPFFFARFILFSLSICRFPPVRLLLNFYYECWRFSFSSAPSEAAVARKILSIHKYRPFRNLNYIKKTE